ncbi:MAG: M15 family metallopeptidase [Candidatus Woesearchaeota archaeon]|jgi:D-alanyl-D-alanine dipeptidase
MKKDEFGLKIAEYWDLLNIVVVESNEKMVNISKMLKNCICIYIQNDMIPYLGKDIWVRESIALKLQIISDKLNIIYPAYILKIVYGYRHPNVQEFYFSRRKKQVLLENSHLDEDCINEMVNTMTAYPETAGHPTGGAVDITLCLKDGREIDMGTKISDFSNKEKVYTHYPDLTNLQKFNRSILHDFMVKEDFAPYYGEWWHFSYGDKEWAFFYDKPNAIYNKIDFHI